MNPQSQALCQLTVKETTGVKRTSHPIFTGVPFTQGALPATQTGGGTLTDETARAYPAITHPAAYWPDGSIKWLHVSARVDLPPSSLSTFTLSGPFTPIVSPFTTAASPSRIDISTPSLSLTVQTNPHQTLLLQKQTPAGLQTLLKHPGISAQLSLTSPDNANPTLLTWEPQPDSLTLPEPQFPGVATLCLTGFFKHQSRDIAEMLLYIQLPAHEPHPQLQLTPVMIFLGDPDKDIISGLTLTAHTTLGHSDGQYALARERGVGHWDTPQNIGPDAPRALAQAAQPQKPENFTPYPGGPRFPQARILQTGSSFYTLEKRTTPQNPWIKIAEGKRNPGWVHLSHPGNDSSPSATPPTQDAGRGTRDDSSPSGGTSGGGGGVTCAMRYFWQEYPRSLSLDSASGQITFGLVPPDAQPLSFKRYSDYKWGASVYETGRGPFNAQLHGATGIAKASQLLIQFEPSIPRQVASTGLFWANPATALPTPDQVADSHVFGSIAAAPAKGFEPLEADMARLLDFIIAERDYRAWYGLLNFGDMLMSFYADKDRWAFDDGGYAWLNTEALPDHALWLSALRSSRHDWLQAAIEMTRHNRDVDIYHRGNFKGTGTRHNVQHWGDADKEWRISMPITQRLHYYLTGDPWTRQVILDTIAVYQSYDRASRLAPSMSSALMGVMVKHELTGTQEDGQTARNMLDLYASAIGPDGHFANQLKINIATGQGHIVPDGKNILGAYFFLLNFGCQHTLVMAQEAYHHDALLQGIIRYCRMCLTYQPIPGIEAYMAPQAHASLAFLAMAFKATGDQTFADALLKHTHPSEALALGTVGSDDPLDEPPHQVLTNARRINKIVCWLGELMNLYPYSFKALQK